MYLSCEAAMLIDNALSYSSSLLTSQLPAAYYITLYLPFFIPVILLLTKAILKEIK
jgi:hypothetical protein